MAIVSSGPSLAGRPDLPLSEYQDAIGVNYAVSLYPCSCWAASDAPVIAETVPLVPPRILFTRRDQWVRLERLHPDVAARYCRAAEFTDDLNFPEFVARKWRLYTIGTALVLAWSLGAYVIDVFGHDMTGTGDCRGATDDAGRTAARWAQEAAVWDLLVARLARDGTEVRRVAP